MLETKKRTVETIYWIGDIVFHRMATERRPGMITCIQFKGESAVGYWVSWGNGTDTLHWAMELTAEFVEDFGAVAQP